MWTPFKLPRPKTLVSSTPLFDTSGHICPHMLEAPLSKIDPGPALSPRLLTLPSLDRITVRDFLKDLTASARRDNSVYSHIVTRGILFSQTLSFLCWKYSIQWVHCCRYLYFCVGLKLFITKFLKNSEMASSPPQGKGLQRPCFSSQADIALFPLLVLFQPHWPPCWSSCNQRLCSSLDTVAALSFIFNNLINEMFPSQRF